MSLARISYWDLPLPVRAAVEDSTGIVTSAPSVGAGLNSSVATLLHTPQGRYFLKALPASHRWVWTQAREAEIAPYVSSVAPALRTRIADHGWDVLIFEALDGRSAAYAPHSPDLNIVAGLLTRMGKLACPPGIELREAPRRLQAYADGGDLHHFAGNTLLHTDLNNANTIINGGVARIVDWGWATRGAAWLDPGYWVIWLIAAGHEPTDAEKWAATVPSWNDAAEHAINAFAAANARLWDNIAGPHPDEFTAPLAAAARTWRDYRGNLRS